MIFTSLAIKTMRHLRSLQQVGISFTECQILLSYVQSGGIACNAAIAMHPSPIVRISQSVHGRPRSSSPQQYQQYRNSISSLIDLQYQYQYQWSFSTISGNHLNINIQIRNICNLQEEMVVSILNRTPIQNHQIRVTHEGP